MKGAKFIRDWMLVFSMLTGAGAYILYRCLPFLHPAGPLLLKSVKTIQPLLLFLMLFLSFCKIEPRSMKPHRWMGWLLLVQCLSFLLFSLPLIFCPGLNPDLALFVESLMLCFICPTATACAVVTGKLGGNMAGVVTYTVLINMAAAVLVPAVVPLVHPAEGLPFATAFSLIMAKVFPLLIMPCLLAWVVRFLLPGLHARILKFTDLSFYIWALSLSLAILMSARSIYTSGAGALSLIAIAAGSLLACVVQFALGRKIGGKYRCPISAGQALGQKNTVFAIWMGYTFMTPVTSLAGGFYSIWHNCYNSYQLYRKRK